MPPYRSRTSTHGRHMAGARGLWRATGMTDADSANPRSKSPTPLRGSCPVTYTRTTSRRSITLRFDDSTLQQRQTAMEARGADA